MERKRKLFFKAPSTAYWVVSGLNRQYRYQTAMRYYQVVPYRYKHHQRWKRAYRFKKDDKAPPDGYALMHLRKDGRSVEVLYDGSLDALQQRVTGRYVGLEPATLEEVKAATNRKRFL